MNLKARIKNQEYELVQGITFSEEYNETLDSANIIIDQVPMIQDLKPYDDVYIIDDLYGKISTFSFNQSRVYDNGSIDLISTDPEFYDILKNKKFSYIEPFYFEFIFTIDGEMQRAKCAVAIANDLNLEVVLFKDHIMETNEKLPDLVSYKLNLDTKDKVVLTIVTESKTIGGVGLTGTWKFNEHITYDKKRTYYFTYYTKEDGMDFPYIKLEINKNYMLYYITESFSTFAYEFATNSFAYTDTIIITDVSKMSSAEQKEFEDWLKTQAKREDQSIVSGITNVDTLIINCEVEHKGFNRHYLVDQFSETLINITEELYKYKIELFSETKGLETIQLPNISITQPRDINKRYTVSQHIENFINLYSPKIKVTKTNDINDFEYVQKYSLEQIAYDIFSEVYTPEFTLNNPNLRDLITQLMLTKDMIPYVENNVIKALDITKRNGKFNLDKNYINYVNASRSSSNHCDNLKRSYINAISQDNTCKRVEYLGFRNKDNALLTIDNMRLETRYPIYAINKIYMCYYKSGIISVAKELTESVTYENIEVRDYDQLTRKIEVIGKVTDVKVIRNSNPSEMSVNTEFTIVENRSNIYVRFGTIGVSQAFADVTVEYKYAPNEYVNNGKRKVFLCKQDITKLVKLNSERQLLKEDWNEFTNQRPSSIDDLAKYRLCTVGYDIGGTTIEGWGTKYTYPQGWWDVTKTYIENIYKCVDTLYPYGIYQYGYLASVIGGLSSRELFVLDNTKIETPFSNQSLAFKGIFFQVEYNAFYNGTVIHSKDGATGQITMNDNSSGSLMLLEQDGLFQKEKINRFGNKAITINARYTDIVQLQPLGSVYKDDNIIYHREYNIFDNCINCVYYATKDYVLKNYFTSVYAKHRPYNLMSYDESVNRAENRKILIILSTKGQIVDKNIQLFFERDFIEKIFSFYVKSNIPNSIDVFETPDKINCALINNKYLSDVNGFVSGNSLCFNLRMYDNVSGGVYIKTIEPKVGVGVSDDFTGSVQDWYIDVDDVETGYTKNMSFELFHYSNNKVFKDNELFETSQISSIYDKIFKLPKLDIKNEEKYSKLSFEDAIYKDNKEIIDMTFQIEPISYEPNKIFFSPWLMKLSDLLGTYNKFTKDTTVSNVYSAKKNQTLNYAMTKQTATNYLPIIFFEFDKNYFNSLNKNEVLNINAFADFSETRGLPVGQGCEYLYLLFEKITDFGSDYIDVLTNQTMKIWESAFSTKTYSEKITYRFKKVTSIGDYSISNEFVAFSNVDLSNITGPFPYEESILRYTSPYGTLYLAYDLQQYNFKIPNRSIANGTNFTAENMVTSSMAIIDNDNIEEKKYLRNLFIKLEEVELKQEIVYNEYDDLSYVYNLFVDDFITVREEKIIIILDKIPLSTKAISFWFLDNIIYSRTQSNPTLPGHWTSSEDKASYKFVFGVNLSEEDFEKGKIEIFLSVVNNMDFNVYDQNNKVIGRLDDVVKLQRK